MSLTVACVGCFRAEDSRGDGDRADGKRWVVVGRAGDGDGRFVTPRGLTVAEERFSVVDRSGRIQEFSLEGVFLRSLRVVEGTVGFPIGLSSLRGGGFVLCDTHNSRLRVFDSAWREGLVIGSFGEEPGQFTYPQRVAVDDDGNFFVSEYGQGASNRIQVFDASGNLLRAFGSYGNEPGHFTRAMGLAIVEDEVFVADVKDRIVVYSLHGEFRREFGSSGQAPGELRYPYGLCARGSTLYVCEYANHRVQRFDVQGRTGGVLFGVGRHRFELNGPWDLALDAEGHLWVCDTGNHRVVSFDPEEWAWEGSEW